MKKGWIVVVAIGTVLVLAGIMGFALKGERVSLYSDDVKYA